MAKPYNNLSGERGRHITVRRRQMLVSVATVLISFGGSSCGGGSSGSPMIGNPTLVPNAVPTISSITPPNATAGDADLTITVTGTGFVSTSTVNWNGSALVSSAMGSTDLTATVPAADIAAANTAQVTVVSPAPGGGTSNALAFVVKGALAAATPGFVYVANAIGVSLTTGNISAFSVDPTTGALTPIPGSPFTAGANPTSVAIDPSSKFLYEASDLQSPTPINDINAFTINPSTGALTAVPGAPFTSGVSPSSISVDSTGKFLYTSDGGPGSGPNEFNSISEYSLDATTGTLTPISQVSCADSSMNVDGSCNAVITDPVGGFLFGSNGFGVVDAFPGYAAIGCRIAVFRDDEPGRWSSCGGRRSSRRLSLHRKLLCLKHFSIPHYPSFWRAHSGHGHSLRSGRR